MQIHSLLREVVVLGMTGKSRTALHEDKARGLFVKPVQIGERAVAYPAHEVDAINRARIAGKGDDEVRALVESLHAARRQIA